MAESADEQVFEATVDVEGAFDDFANLTEWADQEFQFAVSLLAAEQTKQIDWASRTIEFCLPEDIALVVASLDAGRRCWLARVPANEEVHEFESFESLLLSLSSGVQQSLCASIAQRLTSDLSLIARKTRWPTA